MVFNAIFNYISAISWILVLLVEEIRRTWRKPPTCRKSVTNLSHNVVSNTHPRARFELTTLVVIGTDCIGSYISNYHSITTTTVPKKCNFSKWKNSTKPGIKKEPHLGRAPKVE